jgi:hypothetical protein
VGEQLPFSFSVSALPPFNGGGASTLTLAEYNQMKTKLITLLITALTAVHAVSAEDANSNDIKRIGIYDSRAIAIAFVGSEVYNGTVGKEMAKKVAEYKKAESEGDQEKLAELRALGEAQQSLLHKQGFSTSPVDDILVHITGQLPEIKKQAGVELLVSKWNEKILEEHKSAARVDVTMQLIEAFKPNEKQKKSAIEIQKHDPVPLDKMKDHKH